MEVLRLIARSGATLNLQPDDQPLTLCSELAIIPLSDQKDMGVPLPYFELVEVKPENESERG
jgi:hypothetical protein